MIGPATIVGFVGASIAAAAYLGLTILLLFGRTRGRHSALLGLCCVLTAAWAAIGIYQYTTEVSLVRLLLVFGVLHLVAWIALLASLFKPLTAAMLRRSWGAAGLAAITAAVLGWLAIVAFWPWGAGVVIKVQMTAQLAASVAGLTLIELLLRNASDDERWRVKFMFIGLGGILVYNLFVAADSLLFDGIRPILSEARGAIYALLAPLLAISIRRYVRWEPSISVSRKAAFYASTLTASGLYLCAMAAAAFYVRQVGGGWGGVIQAVFLFGAIVLLVVVLASGSMRARVKVFVRKHFYRYKYDYREEWRRFTETVSGGNPDEPLERRVIQAICDIVDSPAGALWLSDGRLFAVASTWNVSASSLRHEDVTGLVEFLKTRQWIVEVKEAVANPVKYDGIGFPPEITEIRHAWAIVPLLSEDEVLGFVLLTEPRAPKTLDWEDFDLLRTIGRQAASYLAEQRAARHLAEFNEFNKFNRRFAFVLHDIKNLVSRFSLIASNVERHGHKPDYREDMVTTIRDASDQMTRLMERIRSDPAPEPTQDEVPLRPLLESLARSVREGGVDLTLDVGYQDHAVVGDVDRITAILRHLVQNAVEAAGADGRVRLVMNALSGTATVEISDNGPGMDDEYIRSELFKPFRSTKESGFGIGVYQCREHARELGGDLEVISSPGSGTTMRVILPLARRPRSEARAMMGV